MKRMSESNEVVLWMDECAPERLASNKVMLCTRNMFLLENMRDLFIDEYVGNSKRQWQCGYHKILIFYEKNKTLSGLYSPCVPARPDITRLQGKTD